MPLLVLLRSLTKCQFRGRVSFPQLNILKIIAHNNTLYDADNLKNKLQPSEAILDIIHFNYYDIERKTDTILYVAYLIAPDKEKIQSIPICEEKELQKVLENTKSNTKTINDLYAVRGLTPNRKKDLKDLTFVWESLLPHLKNYQKLYISPSGLLNKINLGAIPISKDTLAADRFEIVQYNNLRSMLADYDKRPNNDFPLAVLLSKTTVAPNCLAASAITWL